MNISLSSIQINSQENGMGGMGSGSDVSGSGIGGPGYGMGNGNGTIPYLLMGMGSGMEGSESGSGYGMGGYGGDGGAFSTCCQTKKISGSMYPEKDGIYDLATDGNLRSQILDFGQWPDRCRSHCIYTKRDMVDNDRLFCFARSEYSQSKCITE